MFLHMKIPKIYYLLFIYLFILFPIHLFKLV